MSVPGQRRGDRPDHIGHAFACRRLLDCIICPHKLKRFAACHRILDLAIGGAAIINAACHPPRLAANRRLRHVIKEITHRNIEDLTHVPEARSDDPVGAALIFLDLMESDVELGAKLLLAHAEQSAAQAQPFADMKVGGVVVGDPVMPFDRLPVSDRCSPCHG